MKTGFLALLISTLLCARAGAQWLDCGIDMFDGLSAIYASIAADGNGGAFIAWQDNADPSQNTVYLQHVSAGGKISWVRNGLSLRDTGNYTMLSPVLIANGAGGAIVGWEDNRRLGTSWFWPLFMQNVDADGRRLWEPSGIPMSVRNGGRGLNVLPDPPQSAFFAWSSTAMPVVQKTGFDGRVWGDTAAQIAKTRSGNVASSEVTLARAGDGGVLVLWNEPSNFSDARRTYAQRLSADGVSQWGANGQPCSSSETIRRNIGAAGDGKGGAFVSWFEPLRGVVLQHMDGNGVMLLDTAGIAIGDSSVFHNVIDDGRGGALVLTATGGDWRVYRITGSHERPWGESGRAVLPRIGAVSSRGFVSDNSGGAYIVAPSWDKEEIRVQRIDSTGALRYPAEGIVVCRDRKKMTDPVIIATAKDEAMIAWINMSTIGGSVRVAKIDVNGNVSPVETAPGASSFGLAPCHPNPASLETTVEFILRERARVGVDILDAAGKSVLQILDAELTAGAHTRRCSLAGLPAGLYFVRITTGDGAQLQPLEIFR